MPFLPPNQQRQSTEVINIKQTSRCSLSTPKEYARPPLTLALLIVRPLYSDGFYKDSSAPIRSVMDRLWFRTGTEIGSCNNIFLRPLLNPRTLYSREQLEPGITGQQTKSRAVQWTPSNSQLLRTAADRHVASVSYLISLA